MRLLGVHALSSSRGSSRTSSGPSGADAGALTDAAEGLLSESDLSEIEREFPRGLTSVQVVDMFRRRDIRFSEATFRKYVQLGLLARSRRVGRKGKHQGSLGLYPANTVRRINGIKRLMAQSYTIEDIQAQLVHFTQEIDALEKGLATVVSGLEAALSGLEDEMKTALGRELGEIKDDAARLLRRLEEIEHRIADPERRPAGEGAPEGAEDLL